MGTVVIEEEKNAINLEMQNEELKCLNVSAIFQSIHNRMSQPTKDEIQVFKKVTDNGARGYHAQGNKPKGERQGPNGFTHFWSATTKQN